MHIAHHIQQPQLDSTKDYPFIFQEQEDDAEEQRLNDEFVQYLLTTVFAGIENENDTYRGQVETILRGGGYIMNTPQNSSMRYALRQIFLDTSASNAEIEELQDSYFLSITNIRELYNLFKIKENDEYVAVQSRQVNTPNGLRQIIIGYGLFKFGGGPNQVDFSAGLPIISNAFYTSLLNMDVDQAIREDQISKGERVGITISREYTINLDALAYFLADGDGGEFIGFFRESGILDSNLRFKVEAGENPIVDGIYIEGTIDIEEFDESNYLVLVPIAFSIMNEQDGELMYDESFLAALNEPTKTLIIDAIKRKLGGSLIINKGITNEAGQQIYQIDIPLILPKDIIERFNDDLTAFNTNPTQDNSLLILLTYLLTALTLGGGATFLTKKLFSKPKKIASKIVEKKKLPEFELSTTQKEALNWFTAQTVEDEIREKSVNPLQKNYTIDDKGALDINTITEFIGIIRLIANKGGRSKEYHLIYKEIYEKIIQRLNAFLAKNKDVLKVKDIDIITKVLEKPDTLIFHLIKYIEIYVYSLDKTQTQELKHISQLLSSLPSRDKMGEANFNKLDSIRNEVNGKLNKIKEFSPETKTIKLSVNGQEVESLTDILSAVIGAQLARDKRTVNKISGDLFGLFTFIQTEFNGDISSLVSSGKLREPSYSKRVIPLKTLQKSTSDTFPFIYENGSIKLYVEYWLTGEKGGEFWVEMYNNQADSEKKYKLKRSSILSTETQTTVRETQHEIPSAEEIFELIIQKKNINYLKDIINKYSWLKVEIEEKIAEKIKQDRKFFNIVLGAKVESIDEFADTLARYILNLKTGTLILTSDAFDAFTGEAKNILAELGKVDESTKVHLGSVLRIHIANVSMNNSDRVEQIIVITKNNHNSAG